MPKLPLPPKRISCGQKLLVSETGRLPQRPRLSKLPALFASLPHLSPEDAEEFARDLELVQKMGNSWEGYRDPWADET